jgi:hypothetical protein
MHGILAARHQLNMDLVDRGQLAGSLGCTDERLLVAQRNPQAS